MPRRNPTRRSPRAAAQAFARSLRRLWRRVRPGGGARAPGPGQPRAARLRDARWLERQLWGGFSGYARADLERALHAATRPIDERMAAAWALARWHAAHAAHAQALDCIAASRRLALTDPTDLGRVLLESACLHATGDLAQARGLLEQAIAQCGDLADLCLAYANTYLNADGSSRGPGADAARLEWINRVYRAEGLAPLALADPAQPLSLENLTAPEAAPLPPAGLPKISVLVPAHNAAATLGMALRSLLVQTWPNLELLVVDDASDDDTARAALDVRAADPRVTVLRHTRNQGAAAARNTALLSASGEILTTHDADDWSHPQKLELQARALLSDPAAATTLSSLARATRALHFLGPWRPGPSLLYDNISSWMIRAEAMRRLGGWDRVRVGEDSELDERATALFGRQARLQVRPRIPLSFALVHEASLTRAPATHIRTVHYGLRRDYRDAARAWRRALHDPEAFRLDPRGPRLPFPIPEANKVDGRADRRYDLIVSADFSMRAGAFHSTYNLLQAAVRAGLRVAVFHWRRYTPESRERLNPAIRRLVGQGAIDLLSAGDQVSASTLVVGFVVVLRHLPDEMPAMTCGRYTVIVNQMAGAWRSRPSGVYNPLDLRAHMRQAFGSEGAWIPISPRVRRLMLEDARYPAPYHEDWTPLIETQEWLREPLRWRGAERALPVVGRHSRDHITKWPATRRALRAAYCADRACEVRLLGGARQAQQILGAWPANWTVFGFNARDVRAFVQDLDVFVHYPHEDYVEEFGRSTIEAMAAGVPAILPPGFEEIFGEAARYAPPAQVWKVVESLWKDRAAYLEQARRGRAFVERHCGLEQLPGRLERLHATALPDGDPAESG